MAIRVHNLEEDAHAYLTEESERSLNEKADQLVDEARRLRELRTLSVVDEMLDVAEAVKRDATRVKRDDQAATILLCPGVWTCSLRSASGSAPAPPARARARTAP